MNIRDLEYLVVLADYKHFRRAADACHISQPTLSGQIRKLEDELGIVLLERTSRKVLFTQSGLLLVEQARNILREIQLFREMASNQGKEMTGPLHLGVIPTVGPYLLPHIVPLLHQEFPDLELYLYEAQTNQLLDQLEKGQLDCVVLAKVKESDPFISMPLYQEKMLLAVPHQHPWANKPWIEMSELKDCEMLMLDDGHCLREQTLDYCFTAGAKENSHFQATSLETLRNMVAANAGITLIPELAVPSQNCKLRNVANRKIDNSVDVILPQSCKNICYLPCIDPEPSRTIELVYRPGSPLRTRYQKVARMIERIITPQLSRFSKNKIEE
ncbi:DNA-binding transcriptional regulator OxyR [Mergibacter septicus]|uniref:DNA-binding transcriptional regulator OxyR n=1 Tax=Mergibacter septicus TaxID=221402 RepID=A0A8E3SC44_9PAST|nr:DNA-binding transcriptional regulator OxyR [Mergibacter septicus]AWX15827.1 DNA-binding transcriptional regulator OxyR [Mergibacter septicus]QDJ13306.1 DNA-binding transcriptional regulator OxyR [Mergibacter septicus]QDJ15080.1 DNA-binding transcriptional regulator OxyR [Mergibacter septicus]UTU47496.1 DNA-binding transcriptional regulator OxyR [Mergibacter septicus]WMR95323.1 DNA-binding transcriptional regulator OxyR [Mergibacter septicus]